MMAKPIRALELHYPMTEFLIRPVRKYPLTLPERVTHQVQV